MADIQPQDPCSQLKYLCYFSSFYQAEPRLSESDYSSQPPGNETRPELSSPIISNSDHSLHNAQSASFL
ncbi:hypothetical protein RIR_jg7924.t1 [Rhizophagus irregularis DAOM 181602=DAOM 197198]|nr:hypothetical protein RIR_jg7924.t1 [Rhizophagus irregularis DAOM 181602=DAOM 197198]